MADFIRAKSYDLRSSDPADHHQKFLHHWNQWVVLCGLICGGHKLLVRQRMQQGLGGIPGIFAGNEISLGKTMPTTENIVA